MSIDEVWECESCGGVYLPPGVTECDCSVGEVPRFNKYKVVPAPEQPDQETAIDSLAKMRCDKRHDELRRNGGAGYLWTDLQESTREALRQKIRDDLAEYRKYGIFGLPERESRYRDSDIGWQPIETAPKDGTMLLTVCTGEDGRFVITCWWQNDVWFKGWVSGGHRSDYDDRCPTHWMPLPQPPEEQGRRGRDD